MIDPQNFYIRDRVLGRLPTGSGHGGLPNVVVGPTGSGNVILGCLQARAVPDSLSRSVPVTRAAVAADTAQAPLRWERWASTIRSPHRRSSGWGTHPFSRTGGSDGRVA